MEFIDSINVISIEKYLGSQAVNLYRIKRNEICHHKDKFNRCNQMASQYISLTAYRNERNLMFYPFCSTSKGKRLKTIEYTSPNGKYWLQVTANHEYGMAKIWDFDILRFAISKAGEVALKTGHFPDGAGFKPHEYFTALKKSSGKESYKRFHEALKRLAFTGYSGNIFGEEDKNGKESHFTLIDYDYIRDYKKPGTPTTGEVWIQFNHRLLESIRKNKNILRINGDVFQDIKSGVKKRLLDLVPVAMGKSAVWEKELKELYQICAVEEKTTLRRFKSNIKSQLNLPWSVSFRKNKTNQTIVIFKKITFPVTPTIADQEYNFPLGCGKS